MVLGALGGLLIAALIYWYFQMMIEGQQNKNNLLRSEIKVLETQIKAIEGLRLKSPLCVHDRRRWRISSPTAICRCTCSMSWSSNCRTVSTSAASSKKACL
jgi:hypothetical protein